MRPTLKLKADIEYQIVRNHTAAQWEIYRNGVKTTDTRRKKQSAIDRTIAAAVSELALSKTRAVVTLKEGEAIHVKWIGVYHPVTLVEAKKISAVVRTTHAPGRFTKTIITSQTSRDLPKSNKCAPAQRQAASSYHSKSDDGR